MRNQSQVLSACKTTHACSPCLPACSYLDRDRERHLLRYPCHHLGQLGRLAQQRSAQPALGRLCCVSSGRRRSTSRCSTQAGAVAAPAERLEAVHASMQTRVHTLRAAGAAAPWMGQPQLMSSQDAPACCASAAAATPSPMLLVAICAHAQRCIAVGTCAVLACAKPPHAACNNNLRCRPAPARQMQSRPRPCTAVRVPPCHPCAAANTPTL